MDTLHKEQLLKNYKEMRMHFFNTFNEDMEKFTKKYKNDPLYELVVKHFDKNFKQINQIAEKEIESFLK